MAQRTISTRIAIDGEAQYRQSVTNINAELKKYQSALGLVQSEYKTNANSMEALTAKQKALSDLQSTQTSKIKELNAAYKNAQTAVDAYKDRNGELTQKIAANEDALEKLKKTEGDTTAEQSKLTAETEKLKGELAENETRLAAAEKGANNWQTSLNKAQVELNKTNEEIKQNDKYLDEARKSTDKCATSIDEFGNKTDKSASSLDTLASALVSAGAVRGLEALAGAFTACTEASIDYESAITGVKKTTDLTDAELSDMSDAFKQLSSDIPVAASDLAGIAENAGQLGIAKDYIVDFTATMADLGVATNLSGEEAAQTFAKFANITGMAQEDFDRLGSAVVALGNNSATTEADIADMALRLAAAGTQAGMSQADIVAMAAALSSVGLEAEAGGSAFSKAINMMNVAVQTGNEQLTDFASIAGMSAAEFAAAFKEDAAQAVIAFTEGLGNMEAHGETATVLLENLGLTELRLRDSLTRASSAGDLFRETLELGNKAWKENTALTTEAQLRYSTTESRLKLLDNAFDRVKVTIGDQLNPAMQMFIGAGTDALDWIDDFIEKNKWVVPVITGITVALGVLTIALIFSSTIIKATVIPAIKAMTASLMANPIFLVVTAVASLTAALITLAPALSETDEETKKLNEEAAALNGTLEESRKSYEDSVTKIEANAAAAARLTDELFALQDKEKQSNAEKARMKDIVSQLNSMYDGLNLSIDEATGNLNLEKEAIDDVVESGLKQARLQAVSKRLTDLYEKEYEATDNLNNATSGLSDSLKEAAKYATESQYVQDLYNGILSDGVITTSEYEDAQKKLTEVYGEQITAYIQTYFALLQVQDAISSTENEYANLSETTDEYGVAVDSLTAQQQTQYDQMLTLEGEIDALTAAHKAAYDAAYESIDGQIGLFQKLDATADQSITDLIASLDSQITFMNEYSANIQKAMELGVDEGLIQKLSDGSEESAKILAAIVADGGQNVEELNAKFGLVEEGKETFAGTVADMETDFDASMAAINESLDELVENMDKSDKALQAAGDTGDSYAAGLRSRYAIVYAAAAALAAAANSGWRNYYDQHSPSKKAIAEASQTADSYAMGFEQRTENMEETTSDFASAANDAYVNTMNELTLKAAPIIYNLSAEPQRYAETARDIESGDTIIQIDARGAIVRSDEDIEKIAKGLADKLQRTKAAKGRRTA